MEVGSCQFAGNRRSKRAYKLGRWIDGDRKRIGHWLGGLGDGAGNGYGYGFGYGIEPQGN